MLVASLSFLFLGSTVWLPEMWLTSSTFCLLFP